MRRIGAALLAAVLAQAAPAADRQLVLAVPEPLSRTGFLDYLLPRFSLKHGIRIAVADPADEADAALVSGPVPGGTMVFEGAGTAWALVAAEGAAQDVDLARLTGWLGSETGRRTIAAFGGAEVFAPPAAEPVAEAETVLEGDAARGLDLSLTHCGRCHVVAEENRMKGSGNTPSFAVLRTFADWQDRFTGFFALKPHPWFTRLEGVSPPFDGEDGPTIEPVTLTPGQLEDIVTYAARIDPADLGAPIQHQ